MYHCTKISEATETKKWMILKKKHMNVTILMGGFKIFRNYTFQSTFEYFC